MYHSPNNKRSYFRIATIAILILVVLGIFVTIFFSRESTQRWWKSLQSDYSGLNRTITVYDQNGNELRTYTGRIDIEENQYGNKVLFDLDGKRVTLYNAVVIAEEN